MTDDNRYLLYEQPYIMRLRRKAIAKLGRKCRRCGFSDERALQFDHIESDGHEDRKKTTAAARYRGIITGTLKCFQLLCANCNWIKKYENNEHRNGKRPLRMMKTAGGTFKALTPAEEERHRAKSGRY